MTEKPTLESATAGFGKLLEQIQGQRSVWWNYLTFPNHISNFPDELRNRIRVAFISAAFVSRGYLREKEFRIKDPAKLEETLIDLKCWTIYKSEDEKNSLTLLVTEESAGVLEYYKMADESYAQYSVFTFNPEIIEKLEKFNE